METIQQERLSQLRGADLYDSDGDKIGAIEEIYLDDETGAGRVGARQDGAVRVQEHVRPAAQCD